MIPQDVLSAAKLRLRKSRSDILDEDIWQLAEVAAADLRRIGVAEEFLSDFADPLIREAVIVYVQANFGSNPDRDKLLQSYDMLLIKIKGGRYFA